MKLIDLSHEISSEMRQRFPGPVPSIFDHGRRSSNHFDAVDDASFFPNHLGTHVDAPRHYNPETGASVAEIPLERLYADAVILNLTETKRPSEITEATLVDALSASGESIQPGDGVILYTGMAEKYKTWDVDNIWDSEYLAERPWLSEDAVLWLLEQEISFLGIDAVQPDAQGDYRPAHQILLRDNGIPIVENLCNIGKVSKARILFIGFPPRIAGASGFPIRAVALER